MDLQNKRRLENPHQLSAPQSPGVFRQPVCVPQCARCHDTLRDPSRSAIEWCWRVHLRQHWRAPLALAATKRIISCAIAQKWKGCRLTGPCWASPISLKHQFQQKRFAYGGTKAKAGSHEGTAVVRQTDCCPCEDAAPRASGPGQFATPQARCHTLQMAHKELELSSAVERANINRPSCLDC